MYEKITWSFVVSKLWVIFCGKKERSTPLEFILYGKKPRSLESNLLYKAKNVRNETG